MAYEPRLIALPGKHPDEALTYALNFAEWSAGTAVTITTFTAAGMTLVSSSAAALVVTFKLSGGTGGTAGTFYLKVADDDAEDFVVVGTVPITDPAA